MKIESFRSLDSSCSRFTLENIERQKHSWKSESQAQSNPTATIRVPPSDDGGKVLKFAARFWLPFHRLCTLSQASLTERLANVVAIAGESEISQVSCQAKVSRPKKATDRLREISLYLQLITTATMEEKIGQFRWPKGSFLEFLWEIYYKK